MKYKVGDRFISNNDPSIEITITEIKHPVLELEPYKIEYSDGDFGYFKEISIDDYYTKIEETEQVGGNHYSKLAIQPYEYSIKNDLNCYQFNVVKYVTRYKDKNGIEDLKKAIQTLEKLIEYEESITKPRG